MSNRDFQAFIINQFSHLQFKCQLCNPFVLFYHKIAHEGLTMFNKEVDVVMTLNLRFFCSQTMSEAVKVLQVIGVECVEFIVPTNVLDSSLASMPSTPSTAVNEFKVVKFIFRISLKICNLETQKVTFQTFVGAINPKSFISSNLLRFLEL